MARNFTRWAHLGLATGAALALAAGLLAALGQARPALAGAEAGRQPARAQDAGATFVVTNTNNAGVGSLRFAINSANASPGPDTITFSLAGCPCVIALTTALPTITETVSVEGPGAGLLAVDAGGSFRVLDIGAAGASLAGLTVQNGNVAGNGGGIRSEGTLTLTNVNVLSSTAGNSGGGIAAGAANLSGVRLENNYTAGNGGGMAVVGPLTLTGTSLISNTAEASGGGLFGYASVQGTDVRLERNQSRAGAGGGLYTSETLALTDTVLADNVAHASGGGAYAYVAAVLTDVVFDGNSSLTGSGGGLFSEGTTALARTDFVSNTADAEGGALYATGEAQIEGGRFEGNQTMDNHGGAVLGFATVALTDTEFISNTATGYGGAIYADTVVQRGGRFERNTGYEGGAIYASYLVLTDTAFVDNTAISYGGGAYGGETIIQGGIFEGNSAPTDAGALGAGALTLRDTVFISNTTGGVGGGVYAEGWADIHGTHFIGNQAGGDGGGLYASGPLTLTASAFRGNQAEDGGGLAARTSVIANTLLVNNRAASDGMAVYLSAGAGSATLVHVTIAGGEPVTGSAVAAVSGLVAISNTIVVRHAVGIEQQATSVVSQDYNLFYLNGADTAGTVSGGANSLNAAPQFLDPINGNLHLGAGSPAIDAGVDAGMGMDFDGDLRPQGAGFDIGYDEASIIAGLAVAVDASSTALGTPTTFTATVSAGSGVSYTWDFGDGTGPASGNPVSHTYAAPGVYTATVTATNASGSATAEAVVTVVGPVYLPVVWRE